MQTIVPLNMVFSERTPWLIQFISRDIVCEIKKGPTLNCYSTLACKGFIDEPFQNWPANSCQLVPYSEVGRICTGQDHTI